MMEIGDTAGMFANPMHPYTQLLISALPVLSNKGVFSGIPGIPPSLLNPPSGCVFHNRCPKAWDLCEHTAPEYTEVEPGRFVACHLVTA